MFVKQKQHTVADHVHSFTVSLGESVETSKIMPNETLYFLSILKAIGKQNEKLLLSVTQVSVTLSLFLSTASHT